MFLTERAISLATYAIVLLFSCALMNRVARKQYKVILLFYLIALCVFAFNYKPYITADLYRLREYMEYWVNRSWRDAISYALKSDRPAWVLYSWILSRLGNENWLQTITCLWTFDNVFYIIGSEIERNNIIFDRAIGLFYIMSIGAFYLQTISGIRSMLAISIVAYCVYAELIKQHSIIIHIPLYLFSSLLHPVGMVLVLSRLIFILFQEKSIRRRIPLSILAILLILFVVAFLQRYLNSSLDYGSGYLSNRSQYTYKWEILIGLLEIGESYYVNWKYHKCSTANDMGNALMKFSNLWLSISIITLPFSYSVFRRFAIFGTLISLPMVYHTCAVMGKDNVSYSIYRRNILIISSIIFILSLSRGDLCGYKFFVQ